jgi:hypothetical protein
LLAHAAEATARLPDLQTALWSLCAEALHAANSVLPETVSAGGRGGGGGGLSE